MTQSKLLRIFAAGVFLLFAVIACAASSQNAGRGDAHSCRHRTPPDRQTAGPLSCPHQALPASAPETMPGLGVQFVPVTALPGPPDGGATIPKPSRQCKEPSRIYLRDRVLRI